jgi:hypothetical protein
MAPTPLVTIHAATLGECWLRTSAAILEHGDDTAYDGLPIKEVAHMALSVDEPHADARSSPSWMTQAPPRNRA